MNMRDYLVTVAEGMTERAPDSLPPAAEIAAWREKRKARYLRTMGLDRYLGAPRTPLNVQVTQVHQREGFRIECLAYESLPGLWVVGNLYVPDGKGPHPGILYGCGHSDMQKIRDNYQSQGRRFAQLGFVTLVVDTIQLGEVRGYHHGTHRHGQFHWYSRGYYPIATEIWNGIRGLDLLAERSDVDPERLGVTGLSGGGALSWWMSIADDRVKATSIACSTSTIASHVRERTIDGHCDCTFPANPDGWELVDFAALLAPLPVQIVSASRDDLFAIDAIEDFHRRLARVYRHVGAEQNLDLVTYPAPHSYSALGRKATWQWFIRHLQGKEVPLEEIADQDGHLESEETLSVYVKGLPANDRSTTVQDWFVQSASPPAISTADELRRERERVVRALRADTFASFPSQPTDPNPVVVREAMDYNGQVRAHFEYATEPGWRLAGSLYRGTHTSDQSPILVELARPDETRSLPAAELVPDLPESWRRADLSPRGTGSTAWAPAQQWHLRRAAALTGRTLASLRVLDVLQGLGAIRSLVPGASPAIYLAARGEMAAVALYAALLDGNVAGVVLKDPPATQDVAGSADGTGPILEMLNCLRITDLPQVAGLLWPARLLFVGPRPATYIWAEELHRHLGSPGGWWHSSDARNLKSVLLSLA